MAASVNNRRRVQFGDGPKYLPAPDVVSDNYRVHTTLYTVNGNNIAYKVQPVSAHPGAFFSSPSRTKWYSNPLTLSLPIPLRLYTLPYCSNPPFYPNVTTLRSGLCCRNSVCRLSVCRLSSVTLVHPTQGVEPFGTISSRLCTMAIL